MLVSSFFKTHPPKGDIGIEIEVEGRNLPNRINGWVRVRDGSLRGEENAEYITQAPIFKREVKSYLEKVDKAYKKNHTIVDNSDRTSVHIHINVNHLHLTKVFNIVLLFLIFEEMLVHHCGNTREGNLFCLRSKDAEHLVALLESLVTSDSNLHNLRKYSMRYAAINLNSLHKFGSLEFRSMRGTRDMEVIEEWVNILTGLVDEALTYDSPVHLIEMFSTTTPLGVAENCFGNKVSIITSYDNWEDIVWDKLRSLQMMAYSGDWKLFNFSDSPDEDI